MTRRSPPPKSLKEEAHGDHHHAASTTTTSSSSDAPSILSNNFEKWASTPSNMTKWEKSLESWSTDMSDAKKSKAWEKSIA
jgi:hypothetical protein